MDNITHVGFGELTYKSGPDGSLFVFGKATGPDLDLDRQICDADWLKTAMPQWMATGANVREMHQSIAAGVGIELSADGNDWMLKSEVVDDNTKRKVEKGVLKAYSIGIKGARIVKSDDAPNGRIVGGQIVEVSLVDRPANPTATVEIAKVYGGELEISKGIDLEPLIPDTQQSHADIAQMNQEVVYHDPTNAPDAAEAYPEASLCRGCNGTGVTADDNQTCEVCGGSGRVPDGPVSPDANNIHEADNSGHKTVATDSRVKTLADTITKMEHDPADLNAVRQSLINLIKAELDEMAMGEENEVGDVAELLNALHSFLCWWDGEAMENETTAPFTSDNDYSGDTMSYIGLGVSADLIKSASAPEATPEVIEELRTEIVKALGLEETITTKAEVSKAKEEIELLKAALNEVREMATPGGPVLRATHGQVAKAADAERLQSDAGRYRKLADEVFDPAMKSGYMQKALELEADAKALLRN